MATFNIIIDSSLGVKNHIVIEGIAGETLNSGELCYIKGDGKYYKAIGDGTQDIGLTYVASSNAFSNDVLSFIKIGKVQSVGLTIGSHYYLSNETKGAITDIQPDTGVSVFVGVAVATGELDFNPNAKITIPDVIGLQEQLFKIDLPIGSVSDVGYWTKLATVNFGNNDFKDFSLTLLFQTNEKLVESVQCLFSARQENLINGVGSLQADILSKSKTAQEPYFDNDSFKILEKGYGEDVEIWVQKVGLYGQCTVYEVGRKTSSNVKIQYIENSVWQEEEPVGLSEVKSEGTQGLFSNVVFSSIDDMRGSETTLPHIQRIATLTSYYEGGVDGGGTYFWNPIGVGVDVGGYDIQPDDITGNGRWEKLLFSDNVDVLSFGAKFDANYRTNVGGIDVRWWSDAAFTIPATDNQPFFQAALDYAKQNQFKIREVVFPAGQATTDTIYIPAGISLRGQGARERIDRASTKLIQVPDADKDIIRFRGDDDPGTVDARIFWYGEIRGISLLGVETNSLGRGISFREENGETVTPQDITTLENIVVRGMPQDGIEFPDGALPLFLRDIKLLHNNGAGIMFKIKDSLPNHFQACNFTNVSGDGNKDGLLYLRDLDENGNIVIVNLKSEERLNPFYGNIGLQENALILDNCNNTPISICGANHICSVVNTGTGLLKKPGNFIKQFGVGKAKIDWSGVAVRVRAADDPADPDPVIINSADGTPEIPYATTCGFWNDSKFYTTNENFRLNMQLELLSSSWDKAPLRFGGSYLWIDADGLLRINSTAPGFDKAGFEVSSRYKSYSDGSLNAIAGVANATGKYPSRQVWNSSQNRPVYSTGSSAGSTWVFSDGTTSNTPV